MAKGVRTDPAIIQEWRRLRSEGMSLPAIGKQYGKDPGTVWPHVKDIPIVKGRAEAPATDDIDEGQGSLKERVLLELSKGASPTVNELTERIQKKANGESVDIHNVAHVMNALRRSGDVTFREHGQGSQSTWRNIRLTQQGEMRAYKRHREIALAEQGLRELPGPEANPPAPADSTVIEEVKPEPEAIWQYLPGKPEPEVIPEERRKFGPFPLILQLESRADKHRRAVTLLREAGMHDHADVIEADAPKTTPFEDEVLLLVQLVRQRGISLMEG